MTDILGMDSTAEIVTPTDIIEVARKRYKIAVDQAAGVCTPGNRYDVAQRGHYEKRADMAQADMHTLQEGDCSCNGVALTCEYCRAAGRVKEWLNVMQIIFSVTPQIERRY